MQIELTHFTDRLAEGVALIRVATPLVAGTQVYRSPAGSGS